jgi:hypothetical protein
MLTMNHQGMKTAASTGPRFRTLPLAFGVDVGADPAEGRKGNDVHRPVIPKRGEKDFEPTEGSNLQTYQLDRARAAMFDVLRTTRSVSR